MDIGIGMDKDVDMAEVEPRSDGKDEDSEEDAVEEAGGGVTEKKADGWCRRLRWLIMMEKDSDAGC